jgi:large subunit ribosomal protein L34e
MVAGKHKSRTFKRIKVTTPGGTNKVHFRTRKHAKAQCKTCGKGLQSVPTGRPAQIRKLPKNQRRPERPYGGVLCSRCTREHIKSNIQ